MSRQNGWGSVRIAEPGTLSSKSALCRLEAGNRSSRKQNWTRRPLRLSEIEAGEEKRIQMPSGELNRVLGGGLVQGSIILIGGEPGIGKSTLVLQNVIRIRSRKVLYVSGEESAQQLKMRANRLWCRRRRVLHCL